MTQTPNRAALESELLRTKRAKPIARPWLDLAKLPPLVASDGVALTPTALQEIFALQAKEKALRAAEGVAPWIATLTPRANGAFALTLLEQWLASSQDAGDRFALALAGLVGDDRVVARLLPCLPKWCEESRHKLAEYAASAIALVASDTALMALDGLRTRYRTKFRNIGSAANAAFESAAAARGLSPDELGDVVVPRLGFDDEGRRAFSWEGGGAAAELLPDGKLAWHALDDSKTWKSLPSSAPREVAQEVKDLAKQIREAVKAQTLRLEQALVKQRRWKLARFEELFLAHPLGRIFASRLVIGIYGPRGALLRTFRRYANGVLAGVDGRAEELAGTDLELGFVHPLELAAAELAAWREHLTRQRVNPPFPQLERPVARLDPAHAKRRELAQVLGKSIGAGTLRSRSERRGWVRGSVVDAGAVSSIWKEFPGCGIEVAMDLEGFYIGIDPLESVKLGLVRFVRAGTVARGGYVYDDPQGDDPRILDFGSVPPVVWSETVGDLAAIVGEGDAS
ncbi:MAG: DUF4132 domain-containing protein [Planctomycetes bacterium]|nr:DUF4132 domain-containing protein [Planctomycetota bacterium]